MQAALQPIRFSPRRLAHINLYVSELDRSLAFYERVCGIERVRMEASIDAGFLSNGNTHHDIGLIRISSGEDRIGRDGKVQIAATRGTEPGLNHLGWEMENEAALVAAFKRMKAHGEEPKALFDHIVSRAIYVTDPDGNVHEFYSDSMSDWRSVFNLEHDDLVTSAWDPLADAPSEARNYSDNPSLRRVEDAPLHTRNIAGAVLTTRRFDEMQAFMLETAGFKRLSFSAEPLRKATFGGACGNADLTLLEVPEGEQTGLRSFALKLDEAQDLESATVLLGQKGVVVGLTRRDDRESVLLRDPDGFTVEMFRAEPA